MSNSIDFLQFNNDIVKVAVIQGVFNENPKTRLTPYGDIGYMVGDLSFIQFITQDKYNDPKGYS